MKKNLIYHLALLATFSCSTEREESPSSESTSDSSSDLVIEDVDIEFIVFDTESYFIGYDWETSKKTDQQIKTEAKLNQIYEEPNLTTYYDGGDTIYLFEDYDKYLEFESNELNSNKKSVTSLSGKSSISPQVALFNNVNYDSYRLNRFFRNINGSGGGVAVYNISHPDGGTWNDKAGSVAAFDCRVQFFENSFSNTTDGVITGRILVLDDNNGDDKMSGFRNLKDKKFGFLGTKNWNDRISEYRVGRTYD